MPKQTKAEKAKEVVFTEKVAPLMDEIAELCDEHNFPLLIAVQLYVSKANGARIAAQSVDTKATVLPLKISSKLLRGEAKVTLDTDTSFYINLVDDEGNFNNEQFDDSQLETLEQHAEHCEDCRDYMLERMAQGEDVSQTKIMGDHGDDFHDYDNFRVDESMLPMLGSFFSTKGKVIH